MTETIGFSEGFHDAGICILNDTEISFASHSERYSKVKNDKWLHDDLLKHFSCKKCKRFWSSCWSAGKIFKEKFNEQLLGQHFGKTWN